MDEFQINGVGGEEEIGDEFYEKIEAPKFVDLAAPDRCRTENDDRYWFCDRVGCDQKHEEEMDSEAIYKNFVLRVMAARSPSVGLRKALYSRNSRSKLECPRTVPAKSSKSRVSKLAMISSISQKMGEAKVKVRHVSKQNSTTTDVKAAKQSSTKDLTAPRNRKGVSNPGIFRSVRNLKQTTIEVPKDKSVARALVFHSPKKVVKLKKSVEWSSSLRKMCAGMQKLEITGGNKNNNKPLDTSRKQLRRGREVKSRVYDSLHSRNHKTHEANSSKRSEKKKSDKDLALSEAPICHKPDETYLTESASTNPSDRMGQVMGENVKIDERSRHEENIESCSKDIEIPQATEIGDTENALTSHFRVSKSKVKEMDNKENAAAFNENRKLDCDTTGKLVKKDILGRHETCKNIQKVTKVTNKTMKENSTAEKGMKYRKPKLTNPKPFRLRTDERGILKEANLEKKHLQAPLKEMTTFPGSHSGNSVKKHQNVQTNENCFGQIETTSEETDTRTHEDQLQCIKISSSRVSTITPQKHAIPRHQKTTFTSLMKKGQDDKAIQISEGRLEKTKSPTIINQVIRARGVASSRKKVVSVRRPGQLGGAIKEMSPTMPKETSDPNGNGSGTSLPNKASSQRRRTHTTTVPTAPNFHSLQAPKSCTKRVA